MSALRTYILSLAGFLLITLFMPAFLAEPCDATFVPSNNITLERNGMTWEYQEQITGNEAILFRNFIDLKAGDDDNFVNAWEIQKAETIFIDQMKEAVRVRPDVRLNGTSEPVKVIDIDFWLSKEALGRVEKNSSITNSAFVRYIFEKEVGEGTSIWLVGTPYSSVTINLPVGFEVSRSEGLDNKSQEFENNRTMLKGNFGPQKDITLWISENESSIAVLEEREGSLEQGIKDKGGEGRNKTETAGENTKNRKPSEPLKNIFTLFNLSPKS